MSKGTGYKAGKKGKVDEPVQTNRIVLDTWEMIPSPDIERPELRSHVEAKEDSIANDIYLPTIADCERMGLNYQQTLDASFRRTKARDFVMRTENPRYTLDREVIMRNVRATPFRGPELEDTTLVAPTPKERLERHRLSRRNREEALESVLEDEEALEEPLDRAEMARSRRRAEENRYIDQLRWAKEGREKGKGKGPSEPLISTTPPTYWWGSEGKKEKGKGKGSNETRTSHTPPIYWWGSEGKKEKGKKKGGK